jgi:hypothetical protein
MAEVYLLLECWCADEGDFAAGVFSTRDLAEKNRVEECERMGLDPMADKILRVEGFEIDRVIPKESRQVRHRNSVAE